MKKAILVALLVIVTGIAEACPPPTGHAILEIGWQNDMLNLVPYLKMTKEEQEATHLPAGVIMFAGYETPYRWSTLGVRYNWINKSTHLVGGEYKLNIIPEWLEAPVQLHWILDGGYAAINGTNNGYASTAIEFALGYNGTLVQWFIRNDFGVIINSAQTTKFDYLSTGFRFWLGKGW